MFECEQLACAAEAGLHLVDREERSVAPAQLLRSLQIAGRGQVDTLALDGLHEKQRHVFTAQLTLERIEIAERDPGEPGEKRAEAIDEVRVPAGREGSER